MGRSTHLRTCTFCEAACGLEVELEGDAVRRVRGDRLHPESHGFLCPKGSALGWLHDDPDRLRTPMIRTGRDWSAATWDDAFGYVDERLQALFRQHGTGCLALYLGNPASYDLSCQLFGPDLFRLIRHRFSPLTMDNAPKQVAIDQMYGADYPAPIPDLERTQLVWIVGANPAVSNGSMMVAPDVMARLEAIIGRGGKVVVFDPRRTETARKATEHVAIAPGTDAMFLAAVVHTLFNDGLIRLRHVDEMVDGVDAVGRAVAHFSPEAVASACGVDADRIRELAHELAATEAAVVYGRVGTCTQEFGTLASWLVEVVNILTGNLDRPGGAMFPWAITGSAITRGGSSRPPRRGRWTSRVRGLPEILGELPVACLAEDILTPGDGRIHALLTIAGNPALSIPDPRIADALEALDLHVSVDLYLNETSSRADVVLPAESHLHRAHFPLVQHQYMGRQVARWTPATIPPQADRPRDWEVLLHLAAIVKGEGWRCNSHDLDDDCYRRRVEAAVTDHGSPIEGRGVEEITAVSVGRGLERMLDLVLRIGPLGDAFGANPDGLTLEQIKAHPHGLVLAELEPRLSGHVGSPSGRIQLAPPIIVADLDRLRGAMTRPRPDFTLIGRRHLRSNNSWMHNLAPLARGKDRTGLALHPIDGARLGLHDGDAAIVVGARRQIPAVVSIDDDMSPGVVSLPHGWGHGLASSRLAVAGALPGANVNELGDPDLLDAVSGTSVVNGIPVQIRRPTPQREAMT